MSKFRRYNKNNKGPNTDPWGTPALTRPESDSSLFTNTNCLLPLKIVRVMPALKKENKSSPSNYRPISLLSCIEALPIFNVCKISFTSCSVIYILDNNASVLDGISGRT
jgi:hypothetical protein